MQINSMIPLLLSILTGQAGKKVEKPLPRQGIEGTTRQATERTTAADAARVLKSVSEGDLKISQQPAAGQNLPEFLPLPLKTPLFPESRFFVKNNRDGATETRNDPQANVFIRLRTNQMGILWLSLSAKKESLSLAFYTENEASTQILRDSFPVLTEGLQELGYPTVSVAGITRPGIRSCSDIAPGGKTAGYYLIDLEV